MDETTNTPDAVENEEVVTVKKSLLRKGLIFVGATAGLILAGVLLAKTSSEDDDEDEDDSFEPIVETVEV